MQGRVASAVAQDAPVASATDAFFAGNVMETTAEKITVGRTVRGQAESRSFKVTAKTKVDGKLGSNVRVTVRYATTDDGDVAIMIVVRPPVPAPPPQSKQK